MRNDAEDDRAAKVHAFWFVYTLDKILSLRLGRASVIQDWDISLPSKVPVGDSKFPARPLGLELQTYWLKLAQIQGKTYESLFSSVAFSKSDKERRQTASELRGSLTNALAEREKVRRLSSTVLLS